MIPKIIHQIAPEEKNLWHPVWDICHKSVNNVFNNFKLFLWNDKEDIDNFMATNYREYFDFYSSLPLHILKIDFVRYCILDYYGGIYIDMDVFVYKNFHPKLLEDSYILEPAEFDGKTLILNCIMASQQNSDFFKFVINRCVENYEYYKTKSIQEINDNIGNITGPSFLYRCHLEYPKNVQLLEIDLFHAPIYDFNDSIISKHLKTKIWGREVIETLQEVFNKINLTYDDGMKKCFYDIRGVDIDKFNFYHQY